MKRVVVAAVAASLLAGAMVPALANSGPAPDGVVAPALPQAVSRAQSRFTYTPRGVQLAQDACRTGDMPRCGPDHYMYTCIGGRWVGSGSKC